MARQNVRLPILTIERVVLFFLVSLGLREADTFRVLVVRTSRVSPSRTETTAPEKWRAHLRYRLVDPTDMAVAGC